MYLDQTECNSISIGRNTYNIDGTYYYMIGDGLNPNNYPRLISLIDAKIYGTITSIIYPKYTFFVILIKYKSFDSSIASIYKLKII